jgi:MFS family permease
MSIQVRQLIGISVFWLGLSMLFDGVNTLLVPNRLLGLTSDFPQATILGAITFVGLVIGLLVQPLAGQVSDRLRPRWGRRGFLAVGVLLILGSLLTLALAENILALLLGYVFLQISANIAQAAQQGFLPDVVPAGSRGSAAGLKGFMDVTGALVGFILLGQLLAKNHVRSALIVIAATILLTFLLSLILVREPSQRPRVAEANSSLFDAFRLDVRQHQVYIQLVTARFLFLLGTYAVGRFFLFFVADRLNLDPSSASEQAGNLLAGLTLITVLATIPGGWAADKFGRIPLMSLGAVVSALGVFLLIFANASWQILAFGAFMAIGSATFAAANWALTADVVPAEEAARFFGLANFGTAGAAALAGIFGPLVDYANNSMGGSGYTSLFVISSITFLASVIPLRGLHTSGIPLSNQTARPNS